MKVFLVGEMEIPSRGGKKKAMLELIERYRKQGYRVFNCMKEPAKNTLTGLHLDFLEKDYDDISIN